MKYLLASVILVMMACTTPVAVPHPSSTLSQSAFMPGSPAPEYIVGINDGIGGPLPPLVVAEYCTLGRQVLIRTPFRTLNGGMATYASVRQCPTIRLLFLIEDNDLPLVRTLATWIGDGHDFPQVKGFENGNELDLATDSRRDLSPDEFAMFTRFARDIERAAGWQGWIVTGGIYEVNDGHLSYLRKAIDACSDCIVGLHWYGNTDDATMKEVQDLHRLYAITEMGIPSCNKGRNETVQADFINDRLHRLPQVGNVLTVDIYQRLSGSGSTDLDCFGIENKLAWNVFADVVGQLNQ